MTFADLTPAEIAAYEADCAENRRVFGRQDERDGVRRQHRPHIEHDWRDDDFWEELAEAERQINQKLKLK
jgi:hypothetical protein